MERRDTGEDALAAALQRQALLEEQIAVYRAADTSGPTERLERVEALRRDLVRAYLPLGWLVLAAGAFLLEISLADNGTRLPIPAAVYAAFAIAGCVHLAVAVVQLHRRVNERAPR